SPSKDGAMFAAVCVSPARTTDGNVTPTGPVQLAGSTRPAAAAATASGVAGCGVGTVNGAPRVSPVRRSTGAALMPVPPMSMPNPVRSGAAEGSGRTDTVGTHLSQAGHLRTVSTLPGRARDGPGTRPQRPGVLLVHCDR